jgi:cytoskeletal protein CcmA (bactofilin family)
MRIAFLGGLLLLIPFLSFAAEFRTGEQSSFSREESIADDLYMAGGNVSASGSVQGDLIAVGGNVLLGGFVSADRMAGGGTLTILGDTDGDVRFGGGNVTIQGAVGGDIIGGGGQVSLIGESVGGDVAIVGGAVTIDSPIAGVVHIVGGDIRINAPIASNVFIKADKVTLGSKAVLAGNLTYSASEPARIEDGAVVRGTTEFEERPDRATKAGMAAALLALFSIWMMAKFLMILIGAAAITYFFHRFARELVATAGVQPWMEIMRGLIVSIVLPVVSIALLTTVIGIPLGALGLLVTFTLSIFAHLAAPIVLGTLVHKWTRHPAGYVVNWKTVVLGVVIYFFLGLIPFLGGLVKVLVCLLALGAVLNIVWASLKEWR